MLNLVLSFLICVLLFCKIFVIAVPALLITYLKIVGGIWLVLTIIEVICKAIERSV